MDSQKVLFSLVAVGAIIATTIYIFTGFEFESDTHRYKEGEEVILWVNKVGPYSNPQETYPFYTLPYCEPEVEIRSEFEGIGEELQGYELSKSPMKFNFKRNFDKSLVCSQLLGKDETDKFITAIQNQYWYQLFMDDLPIWGMVGEVVSEPGQEDKLYIYTHKKFMITYNGDQIIEVNLTSADAVLLERGAKLEFTYSVYWFPTNIPFDKRFEKYLDYNFFEHQIHWFSIFNSFMMVIFLTGFVSMILMRTLKRDYARYSREDDDDVEDENEVGDESGWKQIHGDVFRAPPYLLVFSALLGCGTQLATLVFFVVGSSILGDLYADRGTIVTSFLASYAITSFVAGYTGGGYYARCDGKHWIQCMLLTAALFPGICVLIVFFLNLIAIGYGTLASIDLATAMGLLFIWGFVCFPLTLVGTVVGRHWNGTPDNPCRINPVPRQVPEKKWFLNPIVNVVLGGVLPFGSIFIEMYFIFTSFWHYKYYYVYGFMLLVYIILIIVTICVTIVSTYFLLNSEDYRWQWVSFLSASSTASYVFLYAIYYFFMKTKMSGFFQTAFYFGYMAMFCVGFGLLCGAIGFTGTSIFVKRIYQVVKID